MSDLLVPTEKLPLELNQEVEGMEAPRVLGRREGLEAGPTLIVVGGIHGNEPAGVVGLQRVFSVLEVEGIDLSRGRMIGLAGNLKALVHNKRFLQNDLNRHWHPKRVEKIRQSLLPLTGEDEELLALDREIEQIRDSAPPDQPIFLLDLHTFSAPGIAFINLEDSLPNRAFAFEFPVPVVVGLEEEISGTLTSFEGDQGLIAAGFESGQHDDPRAIDRAEAAIWIAMEAAGVLDHGKCTIAVAARERLEEECGSLPQVVEVRYRHPIEPDDWFRMDIGFENFQTVQKGQSLAIDRTGPVQAPISGLMLMPLYQRLGTDGFFLVRPVRRAWLELSALLRRLKLERILHWLPGVKRHPQWDDSFIADRRYARWLALEIFHLLGFRREGEDGRYLVMSRRPHDDPKIADQIS